MRLMKVERRNSIYWYNLSQIAEIRIVKDKDSCRLTISTLSSTTVITLVNDEDKIQRLRARLDALLESADVFIRSLYLDVREYEAE